MKFATYIDQGKETIGVLTLDGQKIIQLSSILSNLSNLNMNNFIKEVNASELKHINDYIHLNNTAGTSLSEVELIAPIPKPIHDILCAGVNYEAHRKEALQSLDDKSLAHPKRPILFTKRTSYILGSNTSIHGRFDLDDELDYEVELAVIIGKMGKDIKIEDALDYVFGYSILNDFSSRILQREHSQWLKGKGLDEYCTMGPYIVSSEEFDIHKDYKITSYVNDELRQHSNITKMIYSVAQLISILSQGMTLEPGDIIASGTPSGVGMGFHPPRYLKANDIVRCEIEGIGILENKIIG